MTPENIIKQFATEGYLNNIPETVTYPSFEVMEKLLNQELDYLEINEDFVEGERERLLAIGIDEYKKQFLETL